jgi:hypothetical protein
MRYVVTGVGRCGTTFLMLILCKLGIDTGFDFESESHRCKHKKCNSGFEAGNLSLTVTKSPGYVLHKHMRDNIRKGYFILLMQRSFSEVAASQERYQGTDGGCIPITHLKNHPQYLANLHDDFIKWMKENKVHYTNIDFHSAIQDPRYLYDKLKPTGVIDNIDYPTFKSAWEIADNHQKRK